MPPRGRRRRFGVAVAVLASSAVLALTVTTEWTVTNRIEADGQPRAAPPDVGADAGAEPPGEPRSAADSGGGPVLASVVQHGQGQDVGANGVPARLLWAEEFDGVVGSAPDLRIWTPATGYGWGNGELQCYTSSPRNLALDGRGSLVITARREPSCEGAHYSSARIDTAGKMTMRYGYLETRVTLPTALGSFPAVWMLGADVPTVGWPTAGELDIVEVISPEPTHVHTNIHGAGSGGGHWQAGWRRAGTFDAGADLGADYHVYGVEWTASRLRFHFDGRLIRTINRDDAQAWPWDTEYFLLLNLAIDTRGARAAAGDYPQQMMVDYVRIYDVMPAKAPSSH